ncbi:MAG: hypothetical protein K2Q13_08915 [Nitrosomonas sp.]|nr:hypothetical protein [Nitrosomonas sp.]MBY0475164.1 hypothetical protein [Nitrosomonas sp.]
MGYWKDKRSLLSNKRLISYQKRLILEVEYSELDCGTTWMPNADPLSLG